ncbi:MAG: GNAT family N-acetyltransferase [Candidatus Njordarchaeales archaeon]
MAWKGSKLLGEVVGAEITRFKHRWFGILEVKIGKEIIELYMSGTIAQWFVTGDKVELLPMREPRRKNGRLYFAFDDYVLYKYYEKEKIPVWPVFDKIMKLPRRDPVTGRELYRYKLRGREAVFESDYEAIAELEQFHYASKKIVIAIWRCEKCGLFIKSNTKPICPNCRTDETVHIFEIRGSTPASRFLVIELVDREPYEPKIVAYVRVDPPIPLMHRRLPTGEIVKNIRERVFPKEWFHPVFWPEVIYRKKLKKLRSQYGRAIASARLWESAKWEALRTSNTAAARISRVVVHPDYRSDGIGQAAVKFAIDWINERRIPEMRKRKHLVETIAMMARYNPFFEKVGFKYLWDTASGRPVLYYPLTDDAKRIIEDFLTKDPYAREHKGRLCVSRYSKVERLKSSIVLKNVTKIFENILTLEKLKPELKKVLIAFGVRQRKLQRLVLRNVNLEIKPGEIVVVVGASGAGKTTLLRLIYGAIKKISEEKFKPTRGVIQVPPNAKASILLPGEIEPSFGNESLLEHLYEKTRDEALAVEILNKVGLSDAVLYRARFWELSTGQKERAKLASLLAERPNLLLIDEFAAHLDTLTAMRVAAKLSSLARQAGITLILVTHRSEIIKVINPDKVVFVGYGTAREAKKEELKAIIGEE